MPDQHGTWFRLSDRFPEHPKVLEAGPVAAWLYVAGLAYCARNLTDGHVPAVVVPRLAAIPSARKAAAKLVEVGLWEEVAGGYQVHDYADYQRTAEQISTDKAAARERQRKSRTSRRDTPPPTPPVTRDKGVSHGEVTQPDIDVDTERTPPKGSSVDNPRPALQAVEEDDRLRQCWDVLARLKLRDQRAKSQGPANEAAWLRKVAANDRAELYDQAAERIARYPDITTDQLAAVLNGERSILHYLRREATA